MSGDIGQYNEDSKGNRCCNGNKNNTNWQRYLGQVSPKTNGDVNNPGDFQG